MRCRRLLQPRRPRRTTTTAAAIEAYRRYDDTLRAYQAVDFDDLIALPIALLAADDAAAAKWRERCGYLLVDEYQDTNPAQYRLIRLLVGEARRCSPSSATTTRRSTAGAARRSTTCGQLPKDFPALKVVKLEQNYRSTVRILRSANALIANNPKLFDKKLWSEHGHGDPIRVSPAADDEAEAEGVVRRLLAHRFEHRGRYGDYAILYRGNHQAKLFEQQLREQNVPYEISGGQSYFERAEIKDIVAYLRLVANDDDDPAFIRAVTTPKRGVGATTLERLGAVGGARHESLFAAVFADETRSRGAGAAARDPRRVLHADQRPALPRGARARGAVCSTSSSPRSATRISSSRPASASRPRRAGRASAISSAGCRPRARPTGRTCSS